jgi:hypothetical protein
VPRYQLRQDANPVALLAALTRSPQKCGCGERRTSCQSDGILLHNAWHLREGRADIFIGYCSATAAFTKDLPGGTVIGMPNDLATGADYGLTVLSTKNRNAEALMFFIISEDGQKILQQNGFDAPLLPP